MYYLYQTTSILKLLTVKFPEVIFKNHICMDIFVVNHKFKITQHSLIIVFVS